MNPESLRVWLEHELDVHRGFLRQHEAAESSGMEPQATTGRVMAAARRALIWVLEHQAPLASDWEEDVVSLVRQGQKIKAIRLLREHSALGLIESKNIVEGHDGTSRFVELARRCREVCP